MTVVDFVAGHHDTVLSNTSLTDYFGGSDADANVGRQMIGGKMRVARSVS
jgi:hypothetical protein